MFAIKIYSLNYLHPDSDLQKSLPKRIIPSFSDFYDICSSTSGNQTEEPHQKKAEPYMCLLPVICHETKMIMGCHRSAWVCAGCPPATDFLAGLTVFESWRVSKLLDFLTRSRRARFTNIR